MRFALSEDQAALRDAARELLVRECPPAVVRAGWPGGEADPARVLGVWAKLAEMGVLGAAVPEEAGGLGLGACDVVPLLEEAGRVALPLPLAETAFVAAPALAQAAEAGNAEAGELLERMIAGEAIVAAGLDGSGLVPFAGVAEALLVGDGPGGEIWLVAAEEAEAVQSIDGARALGRVRLGSAGGAADEGGGAAPSDGRRLDLTAAQRAAAWDRGALGAAAQLLGLSRTLLALSTEYVKERRQFGVPIGTFQAVKHHLANALLALEFAAPAALRAAWSLDHGAATASRDVAMAKALASDAAERVAGVSLQVHGAIAYTTEYDLHLFAKRVWAGARAWGDAEWQRARVGAALGLETPGPAVP
ncbi:MAG TPA: acyl-CoA dehydrogenase family protein [Solirubrobacterales bacterium]|nr:acyl-CoA dehydrogenase family protein [Solirubrobacterales bacterium]